MPLITLAIALCRRSSAVVSLMLCGCEQLSGLSKYEVDPPSNDEPPNVPFLSGRACEECLGEQCSDAEQRCADDLACSSLLAARRKCTDPDCHFRAQYPEVHQAEWDALASGVPMDQATNAPTHEIELCAQASCRSECAIGRSWGCVGRYDWHKPTRIPDGPFRLRAFLWQWGGRAVTGATVRVCRGSLAECNWEVSALGPETTDAYGRVDLEIPSTELSSGAFQGYLVFDHQDALGTPDMPTHAWFHQVKPRWSQELRSQTALSNAVLESNNLIGVDFLSVGISDCAGFPADGAQMELTRVDGTGLATCGEPDFPCHRSYTGPNGTPQFDQDRTTSAFGIVFFIGTLHGGSLTATARDADSGRMLASAAFTAWPLGVTGVVLDPLTASDAAVSGH